MASYPYPMHRRFSAVTPTTGYYYSPGLGQAQLPPDVYFEEDMLFERETPVPSRKPPPGTPRKRRPRRKPGRAVKCKVVRVGKAGRRKLCWDKHGTLTSNTKPGGKRGRKGKKVKCKTKCPKGTKKVCTGGFNSRKGSKKKVCRKYTCRKKR